MKGLVKLILVSGFVFAHASLASVYYNTATVTLKAGKEKRYYDAAVQHNVVIETVKEAGNLGYTLLPNRKNLKEVVFKEIWKSKADLDAHLGAPHMVAFFKSVNFDPALYDIAPQGSALVFTAKPSSKNIVIEKLVLDGYQD